MNLAGIVDAHPADAPALVTAAGEVTSYRDLRAGVAAMQARLAKAGVGVDDRVAIACPNQCGFVVAYLAVLRIGGVAVPLNPASPPAELGRQLGQVDVAAAIADQKRRLALDAIAPALGVPVLEAEPEDAELGAAEEEVPAPAMAVRQPSDLAALLFTSGTADAPRPAMLTHGNLLANLDQVQRHPGRAVEATDRILAVVPLSHIFGLNAVLGTALYAGASLLLVDRVDPAELLRLIGQFGVTVLVGTPTLYAALSARLAAYAQALDAASDAASALASSAAAAAPSAHAIAGHPLPAVRWAFCGAAPLSSEVAGNWARQSGLPLRQGYGLTEASPVVTASVMDEPPRPGSIGVPVPDVEIRLVDEDGDVALAGDPGEIWVRGPNVFPGYWHDPEATAIALTDGWLRTGDIAVVADDGQLSIVDRAKDLIIVSGFNVYPAEVEDTLSDHPAVAEVAVVGEADAYRGETVHAFVVPAAASGDRQGAVAAPELIAWCATRLARYKCPTEITIVPSLPRALGGKVLRRSLRTP
ncbi:MAG: AMP-binding protein [Actinomycetota bacterium]|nr:AMP-binding protein [Actinomycetota bacterium]